MSANNNISKMAKSRQRGSDLISHLLAKQLLLTLPPPTRLPSARAPGGGAYFMTRLPPCRSRGGVDATASLGSRTQTGSRDVDDMMSLPLGFAVGFQHLANHSSSERVAPPDATTCNTKPSKLPSTQTASGTAAEKVKNPKMIYHSLASVTLPNDLSHALNRLTEDAMSIDANVYPTGIEGIYGRHRDTNNDNTDQ